jgi:hypothetical protein
VGFARIPRFLKHELEFWRIPLQKTPATDFSVTGVSFTAG